MADRIFFSFLASVGCVAFFLYVYSLFRIFFLRSRVRWLHHFRSEGQAEAVFAYLRKIGRAVDMEEQGQDDQDGDRLLSKADLVLADLHASISRSKRILFISVIVYAVLFTIVGVLYF